MKMQKFFKGLMLLAVASLAACGGGGDSSGATGQPYSITLRSDKNQLPLNVSGQRPSIGASATYTTTLYVDARRGEEPIPGGEDIVACSLVQGLGSGALYYLDGDAEHEDENKIPLPYRSVTLDVNSGVASFHFHAGSTPGTARITCTVTDPRDQQIRSASVDIVVSN